MIEMYDRPILVMILVAFVTWRAMLLIHPGIRRWRAARDLAYAYALDYARFAFRRELARVTRAISGSHTPEDGNG